MEARNTQPTERTAIQKVFDRLGITQPPVNNSAQTEASQTTTQTSEAAAEAAPQLTAREQSDAWFAANALPGENRRFQGNVQIFSGALTFLNKALNWVDLTWAQTTGGGLHQIVDGFRSKAEADLIESKNSAQALERADRQKRLAIVGAISQAGMLLLTASPAALFLPVAGLLGYIRYGVAKSVEDQVKLIAETDPTRKAQLASDEWIQNQSRRALPSSVRKVEQVLGYLYGVGLIGLAAITLSQAPLLSLLYGASSIYQFWKARRALPPVIKYYEALEAKSAEIVNAPAASVAVEAPARADSAATNQTTPPAQAETLAVTVPEEVASNRQEPLRVAVPNETAPRDIQPLRVTVPEEERPLQVSLPGERRHARNGRSRSNQQRQVQRRDRGDRNRDRNRNRNGKNNASRKPNQSPSKAQPARPRPHN